ncbi:MAG: hypothetical protein ACTSRU_14200 [Candidatus Hodarchaeales archaeon]
MKAILKDGSPNFDWLNERIGNGKKVTLSEWEDLKKNFEQFWNEVLKNSGSKPIVRKKKWLIFFEKEIVEETCNHQWQNLFHGDSMGRCYADSDFRVEGKHIWVTKGVPHLVEKTVVYPHGEKERGIDLTSCVGGMNHYDLKKCLVCGRYNAIHMPWVKPSGP